MFSNVLFTPTIRSSLKEWLMYIQKLSHVSIDLTLERVRTIAITLDLLHPSAFVILVGGTNGKGTTCCLLETILLNSNISVGLYTSPHLISYNERIRVYGKELPDNVHIQSMSVIDSVRNFVPLTYFEYSTLSALYIFKQFNLDVIILEVGLGGRLDATNVVDADISVITNVAIDHCDILGIDRDSIAAEKSGIFRKKKPVVIGEIGYSVVLDKMAKYYDVKLFSCGKDWNFSVSSTYWSWWDYNYCKLLNFLPLPIVPVENAATALGVLYWLPFLISRSSINYGLRMATLPGRFQILNNKPIIILDVGHNPHAANYLVHRLFKTVLKTGMVVRMVIGMLKNKDIKNTVRCLSRLVTTWYIAPLDTPLSADILQFSDVLMYCRDVRMCSSILDAWFRAVSESSINDCIVVFGSFYTVSEVIKGINNL